MHSRTLKFDAHIKQIRHFFIHGKKKFFIENDIWKEMRCCKKCISSNFWWSNESGNTWAKKVRLINFKLLHWDCTKKNIKLFLSKMLYFWHHNFWLKTNYIKKKKEFHLFCQSLSEWFDTHIIILHQILTEIKFEY